MSIVCAILTGGGLGLAEVLDYIGVDYEFRGEQLRLEWEEGAG